MNRMWPLITAMLMLFPAFESVAQESLEIGSIHVELGLTPAEVEEKLQAGYYLGLFRDKLPQPAVGTVTPNGVVYEGLTEIEGRTVSVEYRDEFGVHAFIASKGSPDAVIGWLVFEEGKLTRATRLVLPPSPTAWLETVAATIRSWRTDGGGSSVVVTTFDDSRSGITTLDFKSGNRELTLVQTPTQIQLVENLGRSDILNVTYSH